MENKIAVIIPAYRVAGAIENVIKSLPSLVSDIIVVDDGCPESSGAIAENLNDNRVTVVYRERNGGVGAAMKDGFQEAIRKGAGIIIKIDGDGQMDSSHIENIVDIISNDYADYVKGNRLFSSAVIKEMPRARLFGNSFLSFFVKAVSGYWDIMDPTNGFIGISSKALGKLAVERLADDYYFEIDMLTRLYLVDAVVCDVAMPAIYADEISNLRIFKVIGQFPHRLVRAFIRRIFFKYFIADFNVASVYMLVGVPLLLFGSVFGLMEWIDSIRSGIARTSGTIMLSALPILLGLQFVLAAVHVDISNIPSKGKQKWYDGRQRNAE